MMRHLPERIIHSGLCLAAFVGWYLCTYLVWWLPGFATLYRSGLAISFLHAVILLPFSLLLWKVYSRHYPFLTLGQLSLRGLLLPVVAIIALTLIHGHFAQPEPWAEDLARQTAFVKWMTILAVCICAPIGEEIIFRGLVLNSSIGWGRGAKTIGIVGTSLLFALVHTQYSAATSFVYLFIFSAILCVVRINTRSLIMPMALHALNNCWVVLVLFFL